MSLYRGTVFFLRGLREFTRSANFIFCTRYSSLLPSSLVRSGFERASRSFQESDLDVDVSGLVNRDEVLQLKY